VPWLEPDAAEHLSALADAGTKAVIVCPIGFVADHIEVVWDLDYELRELAEQRSVAFARVATPNADRRFARLAVDLIDELRDGREPARFEGPHDVKAPPLYGFSIDGALCTPECGPP
jgi:ferrochelatase